MTNFHFATFVAQQAKKYGEKVAFRHKDESSGNWISTSWNKFSEQVNLTAKAFAHLGIKVQDNVAVFSQNKPEIFISEFGLYLNRAVSVPLYATSSISQVEYIVNDAEIATILVGEQDQYDVAIQLLGKNEYLKQIIIFDQNVKREKSDKTSIYFDDVLKLGESAETQTIVDQRVSEANPDDLANLIYTSGTTGVPKGVMLAHSNYIEAMDLHSIRLSYATEEDVSVCFLPLSHIYEKAWSYFCLFKGVRVDINLRPNEIQTTLKEVRPTIMCSVPRLWEKIYAGIQSKIERSSKFNRLIMFTALKVGKRRNIEYVRKELKVPFVTEMLYRFFHKLIFIKLKRIIGIENGNFFPVAGAPLSDGLNEFFHACGIDILYGYGLTETTATVACYFKQGYTIGSVGVEMPRVEIKIGENNEILVKGKTVMKGYYKKPAETAEVFTADGWFKTGDAGSITENGVLSMTERIKDLIKTSNGKYVAPQALELKIGEDTYIDQIAIIGDHRQFVSALIVPAFDALKEYANSKQIAYKSMEELIKNSAIIELIQAQIKEKQKHFAAYEQIKKFTLLSNPFSMENGEITNTLKLKRNVIKDHYSAEIEAMYA